MFRRHIVRKGDSAKVSKYTAKKMPVTLCWATELHEHRFGEIHALLTGVNQLLSDFGGIGCQIPPHGNAVEYVSSSRISALGRPYSPYVRKWSVTDSCTVQPYGILKMRMSLLKCTQWRTWGGGCSPPEIRKALQNRAKLNRMVKTVKNCWI